jgi:hypothetical protein
MVFFSITCDIIFYWTFCSRFLDKNKNNADILDLKKEEEKKNKTISMLNIALLTSNRVYMLIWDTDNESLTSVSNIVVDYIAL